MDIMHDQTFLGIVLILIGLFPILAVRYKWKFFFENWRAAWLKDILGETGQRFFYFLFACALILTGLLIIFRVIGPEVEKEDFESKEEVFEESEEALIKELVA